MRETLDEVLAPWGEEDAAKADDGPLGWLADVGEAVNDIFAHWRDLGLPAAEPLSAEAPRKPASAAQAATIRARAAAARNTRSAGASGAEAEGEAETLSPIAHGGARHVAPNARAAPGVRAAPEQRTGVGELDKP